MSKVQEHGFRSAFLKNYALIKQAHQMSVVNDEDFYGSPTTSLALSDDYANNPDLMKQYFKIAKGPFFSGNGNTSAIRKLYNNTDTDLNQYFKYLNGSHGGYWNNTSAFAFQVEDGTILAFHVVNCHSYRIMIDVNGAKGPNTYGKDIYFLEYTVLGNSSNSPLKNTGQINQIVPSGILGTQVCGGNLYWEEPANDCTKRGAGFFCAREIVKDKSYKIK